jgi:hypothetical protein
MGRGRTRDVGGLASLNLAGETVDTKSATPSSPASRNISILAASRPGFVSPGPMASFVLSVCAALARLDTRFLGVWILSHVLRRAAHLGALRALLLDDGSDGMVEV